MTNGIHLPIKPFTSEEESLLKIKDNRLSTWILAKNHALKLWFRTDKSSQNRIKKWNFL
jgi:hypothetical protein